MRRTLCHLPLILLLLWTGSQLRGRSSRSPSSEPASWPELQRYSYSRFQMGTRFDLTFYASSPEEAARASTAALDRIEELEEILSSWREESELTEMLASAHEKPVVVSDELFRVLERSQEISRLTSGAFDITIGPLVELWQKSRRQEKLPAREQIQAARSVTGFEKVLLNPRTRSVRLREPGVQIDLGGVGKGFAGDEVLKLLAESGIERALLNAGGDVRLGAPPPGRHGWKISLASPGQTDPIVLSLKNCAVATSGDLFQFVEIDGVRYSHILDPESGVGLTHRGSVTVLAPDGVTADALATAFSVLPIERGMAIAGRMEGVQIRVTRLIEGVQESRASPGFPP